MKRLIALLPALCLALAVTPVTAVAEEANASATEGVAATATEATAPQDNIVTTQHSAQIGGKKLSYTAEAGTMALETSGQSCEVFYTAYLLDGVKDKVDRPITFAFNGGPGSASMYVHIGCFGPRRLDLDKDGNPTSLPTKLKDNESSILDITDLVIVDAVGTGYSRPAEGADTSAFYSYEGDISTMGDFIRLYINRKGRWGSEKYLAGESYGTTRAVGVCEYLSGTYKMDLNGLMLISSVNDFLTVSSDPGNDMPYAFHVPTYAADAWYHKKVAKSYQEMKLEDFLDEVRTFVEDTYVPALFKGQRFLPRKRTCWPSSFLTIRASQRSSSSPTTCASRWMTSARSSLRTKSFW